jgi:hypothetical protein
MNKMLLVACLLWSGRSAQAQEGFAWPHNPKTGEVEMQGMLPWPDSAKTELQRRRLVQHWYATKLAALLTNKPLQPSSTKEPYYGVPLGVRLSRYQADPPLAHLISVVCQAEFMPTPKGLEYQFTDFNFTWWEDDTGSSDSLDRLVFKDQEPIAVKGREIIATARKRLAALGSW